MILFSKMQALGNDFVVLDATQQNFDLSPEQIRKMSDRRYGVGFDQLLLIEANQDGTADFNYRIFNADASESYQCGNGARCLAKFIREKGLSSKNTITIKTQQVSMKLTLLEADLVQVFLDPPKFEPTEIPLNLDQKGPKYTLPFKGKPVDFYVANVGNPHAVIFDAGPFDIDEVGAFLGKHACLPEEANVGFVRFQNPQEIHLDVFERGAGRTLACGSGACAAAVTGIRQGLLQGKIRVKQAGGDLVISWAGSSQPIEMIGPAAFVFDGQYHL